MTATTPQAARRCVPWPKDALRIGFGAIWLIDAALKWLPGFKDGYMDTIMGTRDGQPSCCAGGSTSGSTSSTPRPPSSGRWSPPPRPCDPDTAHGLVVTATAPPLRGCR